MSGASWIAGERAALGRWALNELNSGGVAPLKSRSRPFPEKRDLSAGVSRLLYMDQQRSRFHELRRAYELAFAHWSAEVQRQQAHVARSELDKESAGEHAKVAESAYRVQRDRLASYLLTKRQSTASRPPDQNDRQARVRLVAYYRWVNQGSPTRRAEQDWYQAEQLVGEYE